MPTTPYTFRMENDLREALKREARIEDRPAAQLAARAIRSMVQARAARRAAVDAALAAAGGAFISQDAMNRWIDSWGSDHELPMPEPDIGVRRR